ncbi:tail fiber domain-containing protein [Pseudovibrio exalbescens]|nr:tail fiber domain-containing protein [Pseudovibrio exalbescens]
MRLLAFFIVFGFAAFLSSQQAYADCVNPPGKESKIIYNRDHKAMQFCNGTAWTGMAGGSSSIMEGDTMVEGWPDAIACTTTSGTLSGQSFILYNSFENAGSTYRAYVSAQNNSNPPKYVRLTINNDGSFGGLLEIQVSTSSTAITGSCTNKSISELYEDGQAFNFVGGGVVGGAGGADTLAGLSCSDGQMVVYDDASSAWVCVDVSASGAADNLGDHTATQDLDLATHEILNVSGIAVSPVAGAGKPNNFENPSLWTQSGSDIYVTGGNVGIGTASPADTLHVHSIGATGLKHSRNGIPTQFMQRVSNNGSVDTLITSVDGNDNAGIAIDENGNVGIGTTSPTAKLHFANDVAGAGDANMIQLYNDNGGIIYGFGMQSGGLSYRGGAHIFYSADASTEYMRIANSGNLGLGTISPKEELHIKGNAALLVLEGTDHAYMEFFPDTYAGGRKAYVGFGGTGENFTIGNEEATGSIILNTSAAGTEFLVSDSGNTGVGVSSPSYKLHVGGQVAGNAAYVNTSDARLKKDVADISYGISDVMKLRPVTFYWKDQDADWQQGRKVGLIAQEVEKIAPEVVSTADDEMKTKSIAYGDLVPLLIKSVQEQQAMIEKLEAANDNLTQKVDALEKAADQ